MNKIDEFGQVVGEGDARRAVRDRVLFLASLARAGGEPLGQAKVRNISSLGLLAETGVPLRIGEAVQVDLRGIGAVTGVVIRRTPNAIAIKFDLPIDPKLTRRI